MAIEIGPGWTIGGGITISTPPPSTATAGWFGGGYVSVTFSTVNRIIFATDTATASVRGPLSLARYGLAGSGTVNDGWFAGGQTTTLVSTVDRITYATDTATASVRGPLSSARRYVSSASDSSTYSWIGGGIDVTLTPSYSSQVSRITYATDTGSTSLRGPLSLARSGIDATGTSQYGWNMGGYAPGTTYVSIIDRIDYANDTATASVRGPLSSAKYKAAAVTDSSTYGWYAGGSNSTSVVDRVTYATDTATATARGPLATARSDSAGTCDNTYGWIGGGITSSYESSITRITYATDTATSTNRSYLSVARTFPAGSSGIQ